MTMATTGNHDLESRINRLESELRRYSRRLTVAASVLVAVLIALGAVVLTPVGPWVQVRLPWSVNLKVETVSAKRFIVVDGDKERAGFGLNPPVSFLDYDSKHPRAYPSGLAALWFHDDLDPIYGYRILVGLEEDTPQKGTNGQPDLPRYQPVIRGIFWPSANNRTYQMKWPVRREVGAD
jgi:hypothetical protein